MDIYFTPVCWKNYSIICLFEDMPNTFWQIASTAIILIIISNANAVAHVFHHIDAQHSVSCGSCVFFRIRKHALDHKFGMSYIFRSFLFSFALLTKSNQVCLHHPWLTHISIVKNMKWKWTNNLSSYLNTVFCYFYRQKASPNISYLCKLEIFLCYC